MMEDVNWKLYFTGVFLILLVAVMLIVFKPAGRQEVAPLSFVSGTEYNIQELGQVIVEARFNNGTSALLPGNCTMLIWYPNKTLFLNQMAVDSGNGNQYVEFLTPNQTGVYEYQAQCNLTSGMGTVSKSFHVSEFQNASLSKMNRIKAVTAR